MAPMGGGRAWAAAGLACLALALVALPVVAALGLLPVDVEGMGRVAAALAALAGAGKLAAVALGVAGSAAAQEP